MTDDELQKLIQNPNIIRNKLKINAARQNARVCLSIQKEFGSLDSYLWQFVHHQPIKNHWHTFQQVPATTTISDAISKDLKKRGMKFVGSTIIYAFMQAVGMVNDHMVDCWRYES